MKVLLALDGTPLSESLIPFTTQLARRWQAELLLVRACDPALAVAPDLPPTISEKLQLRSKAAAHEYLEGLVGRLEGLQVSYRVPLGRPRDAIASLAAEQQCDLIVMATHGRTGADRWLIGSVTEGVLRRSHTPILMLHPPPAEVAEFRHILVPLDGSESSQRVLQQLAPFLGSDTRVSFLQSSGLDPQLLGVGEDSEALQHYLDQMAVRLRELHLEGVEPAVVVCHGDPVAAILDFARENHCDLIAMATQGRTGRPDSSATRWLGSVTEKVARSAPCPVLACPKSTG